MIITGCCGFPVRMEKYFEEFKAVEVQKTFYRIPEEKTLKKWREMAGKDFIFCVKCFQGVTHPPSSPTWRRFGKVHGDFGLLRPTKDVFESWEKTLRAAKLLDAEVILIQLPKSFKECEESFENAERFFSEIEREFEIAMELRGWSVEGIKRFCEEFDVIDCADLSVRPPTHGKIFYSRIHGRYEGERIVYKHKFSEEELEKIATQALMLKKEGFVFFNNTYMYENAKVFEQMIKKRLEV